jgi:hypothetical protein
MRRKSPSGPLALLVACLVALGGVPPTASATAGSGVHYLPPTRVRIGPHAVARHGKADLIVECLVGEPGEVCRGGIGLHALMPDGNGSFYVGRAHFEIPLGEKTTVWASLSEGARTVLANRGALTASAFSVILVGVSEAKVRIVAAHRAGS